VIYVAAVLIVAGVALFVAAPLSGGILHRGRRGGSNPELERLRHDRALAVQGLRELEFDREMGKLNEADYQGLRTELENRALAAMNAIEKIGERSGRDGRTALRRQRAGKAAAAQAIPQRINFCPQCGSPAGASHNFCAQCGTPFRAAERRAVRAD
jgi:cytochrome c-type biogenesis protein CcmI